MTDYNIGKPCGFAPRGNALSSVGEDRPALKGPVLPAAAFSAAWSALGGFWKSRTRIHRGSGMRARPGAAWRHAHRRFFAAAAPARAVRLGKIIVAERRIRHHRDAVLLAPRDHRVLDRALLQMIEHLVAGDTHCHEHLFQLVEIVDIEIADAPAFDLAGGDQLFEGRNRVRQRIRSRASAADSNRAGRSSAASANARRR